MTPPIELGRTYVDRHTGWRGVATGRAEYVDSGEKVLLERLQPNGTISESWFAAGRLDPVDDMSTPGNYR